jgi:phosphinothricin acetyltransferase
MREGIGRRTIRFARPGDFAAVCSIVNVYIATSTVNFRTEPQTPEEWERSWAAGRDRHPWYVAEVDGVVSGVAYSSPWNTRAAYDWTAETTVYVDERQRGRGLGGALYTELLKTLETQGYRSAIAVVALPNDASVALHESFGFRFAGRVEAAGHKFGAWHDVGFWQRGFAFGPEPPAPIRPPRPL